MTARHKGLLQAVFRQLKAKGKISICPLCGEKDVAVFYMELTYECDPERGPFRQFTCVHETKDEIEELKVCLKNDNGVCESEGFTIPEAMSLARAFVHATWPAFKVRGKNKGLRA